MAAGRGRSVRIQLRCTCTCCQLLPWRCQIRVSQQLADSATGASVLHPASGSPQRRLKPVTVAWGRRCLSAVGLARSGPSVAVTGGPDRCANGDLHPGLDGRGLAGVIVMDCAAPGKEPAQEPKARDLGAVSSTGGCETALNRKPGTPGVVGSTSGRRAADPRASPERDHLRG